MLNSRAVIQKIAADLSVCWWQILALLVVSAVLSFLWTVVLRIFGGLMIYVSIGLLLILLATGRHHPKRISIFDYSKHIT